MRTVVSNNELPHLWAHQTQSHAKNNNGSYYFEGSTIYSYGSHFPIARMVNSGNGMCVLMTTRTRSITTAKHIGLTRQAVHHLPKFYVNDVTANPSQKDVNAYAVRIMDALVKASRARTNKSFHIREAQRMQQQAIRFAQMFNLDASQIPTIAEDEESIKAMVREEQKRQREYEQKRQEQLQRDKQEILDRWLSGNRGYNPPYGLSEVFLRVVQDRDGYNGPVVETSKGAWFPLKQAQRAFALVKAVMERGEVWVPNGGVSCKLGYYQINEIWPDGTVIAGCHTVAYRAMERIREQLESGDTGSSTTDGGE